MKSILAGYNEKEDALEHLGDELAGYFGAEITDTHRQAVETLSKLMTLGADMASEETPLALRVLMRTLISLKPTLLEMLAKVPASDIVRFMTGLRDDIQQIIDSEPPPQTIPSSVASAPETVARALGD